MVFVLLMNEFSKGILPYIFYGMWGFCSRSSIILRVLFDNLDFRHCSLIDQQLINHGMFSLSAWYVHLNFLSLRWLCQLMRQSTNCSSKKWRDILRYRGLPCARWCMHIGDMSSLNMIDARSVCTNIKCLITCKNFKHADRCHTFRQGAHEGREPCMHGVSYIHDYMRSPT